MSTEQAHEHFMQLLRSFDTAVLVTRSQQGPLHARPMLIADVGENGELWFVTDVNSPKVEELFADSQVAVVMMASEKYVTVTGQAEVRRDPARIQELWRDAWQLWFDNQRESELALIRVGGLTAEYWDNSSLKAAKIAFRTAKAYLSGEEPDIEREAVEAHARLTLP